MAENESSFHLIDRFGANDEASRNARQEAFVQQSPPAFRNVGASAKNLAIDRELETAMNAALCLHSPLLVAGEPGTGKTSVAYFLAQQLGLELYSFHVKSTSTVRDLQYDFDAVAYLHWAYRGEQDRTRADFTSPGPLWKAYDDKRGSVLLIDEIDKAPRDFPNDLLLELDAHRFPHPHKPGVFIENKGGPCAVIITSNGERRLPEAFLRRCVYHAVALDSEILQRAVNAHRPSFPDLDDATRIKAIERFEELRSIEGLSKKPGTSELLAWLAVLSAQGKGIEDLEGALGDLPATCVLLKDRADHDRL